MANLANLVNFGAGGAAAIGDVVYSAYGLTAPSYLPLNSETASYLASSYPVLGAQFTTPATTYAATARTLATLTPSITDIAYGNGVIVAIAARGGPNTWLTTSRDGINWTVPQSLASNSTFTPTSIVFGGGKFVIVGVNSSPIAIYALVSTDGINWSRSTINTGTSANLCIGYGAGLYMTFGVSTNDYYWSNDAITWTQATGIAGLTCTDIAYGNGTFVAVSKTVNSAAAYYKVSSATWVQTAISFSSTERFNSVAFGNGVFVTVDGAGSSANTNIAATSPDGVTWTQRTLPASLPWKSVTFGNGVFMAVANGAGGTNGTTAATSPDGITWTLRALPTSTLWGCVEYVGPANGGFFVATGATTAAATIEYSVTQASFTLPVAPAMRGMVPYIKAT